MRNPLGIYEKALPRDLSWPARLELAKELGFDFLEMSIDESDERLSRLDWSPSERGRLREAVAETGVRVPSMCLSGHRRFPFGSHDPICGNARETSCARRSTCRWTSGCAPSSWPATTSITSRATRGRESRFIEGLRWAVDLAQGAQVMLAVEIMDTPFINSIAAWREYDDIIRSPFFCVYPDLGNLSAWGNDVQAELRDNIARIVAIHLKDTLAVTPDFPGRSAMCRSARAASISRAASGPWPSLSTAVRSLSKCGPKSLPTRSPKSPMPGAGCFGRCSRVGSTDEEGGRVGAPRALSTARSRLRRWSKTAAGLCGRILWADRPPNLCRRRP